MDAIARPPHTPVSHAADLGRVAAEIDRHGLDTLEAGVLTWLAARATAAGAPRPLIEVLLDDHAPVVARCRAFGRIHGFLARGPRLAATMTAA